MTAKKTPVRVSDEEIVDAYLTSTSADETARKLNISVATLATRVKKLREAKVNLPEFARPAKTIDADALNARIAAKLAATPTTA